MEQHADLVSRANKQVLDATYPPLTLEAAKEKLKGPYPAWLLAYDAVVLAANLLSAWVWEGSQLHNFLGLNAATIFSRNFRRIPKDKNGEFYTKKTAVFKRLIHRFGIYPYRSYIEGLRVDPDLWNIYEWELWLNPNEWETTREWQYPLRIMPPGANSSTDLLEFQATVYRLKGDIGFFAMGEPQGNTIPLVQQEYTRLKQLEGTLDYIQYFNEKKLREIEEGRLPTIHIRIDEESLSTHRLATIMLNFTQLFTKLWLTTQGRIADLVEYTLTQNTDFSDEANLIITDITHNSPFGFDLNFSPIDPEKWAKALQTLHDMIIYEAETQRKQGLENQRLEQEIIQKNREFEESIADRDQARATKVENDQLDLKQKRLKLAQDTVDYEYYRLNRAIDTAKKLVELLLAGADDEKKAIATRTYLENLLRATAIKDVDFFLLPPYIDENKDEGKTT